MKLVIISLVLALFSVFSIAWGEDDKGTKANSKESNAESKTDKDSAAKDSNKTPPAIKWRKGYNLPNSEGGHPHHGVETKDGGFAVIGETDAGKRYTMFVLVTDKDGGVVFRKDFGAGGWSNGNHVLQEPDGNFLVAGSHDTSGTADANSLSTQEHERVILRIDPKGNVLAKKTFPSKGRDAIRGLHLNSDGTIIAVGYKGGKYDDETFIITSAKAFIMKLNKDFEILWEKDESKFAELRKVLKSKDGKGYVAAGNMLADESAYFSLHFTDLEGKAKNSIKYDLGDLYDFDMDSDGNYIMGGHVKKTDSDPDGFQGMALKVDKDGKKLWLKYFGNADDLKPAAKIYDECYGVRAIPSGGYIFACGSGVEPPYTSESPPEDVRMWRALLARFDKDGNLLWQKNYTDGKIDDASEYVVTTSDGGFAFFNDSTALGGYGIYRLNP